MLFRYRVNATFTRAQLTIRASRLRVYLQYTTSSVCKSFLSLPFCTGSTREINKSPFILRIKYTKDHANATFGIFAAPGAVDGSTLGTIRTMEGQVGHHMATYISCQLSFKV